MYTEIHVHIFYYKDRKSRWDRYSRNNISGHNSPAARDRELLNPLRISQVF